MALSRGWTPKSSALRDLILLALYRTDGHVVEDENGRASAVVLGMCGIPDTETNRANIVTVLKRLEEEGVVTRNYDSNQKRTYQVLLVKLPTELRIAEIDVRRRDYLRLFERNAASGNSPAADNKQDELEKLVADCERALDMIRHVASKAARETSSGRVAMTIASTLRTIGISGDYASKIRYYLRTLGLAKAIEECGDGSNLWWWEINDKPLNHDALRKLATSELSYEMRKGRRRRSGEREDRRTSRYAGDAPATLPDHLCGPVTFRTVEPKTKEKPAARRTTATKTEPHGDDTTELEVLEGQLAVARLELQIVLLRQKQGNGA